LKSAASGLAALLAKDLEGVPDYSSPTAASGSGGTAGSSAAPTSTNGHWAHEEDLEADFSKRYPSLAGIEMVETEIGSGEAGGRPMRIKEV